MKTIKAGIVGATGYAGSEICRLLFAHPEAEVAAISYETTNREGSNGYGYISSMHIISTDDMVNWTDHGIFQIAGEKASAAGLVVVGLHVPYIKR